MIRFNVRARLTLLFATAMIALGILATTSTQAIGTIATQFSAATDISLPIVTALEELKTSGLRVISSSNEHILDHTLGIEEADGELAQIAESIDTLRTWLGTYRTLIVENDPEDMEILRDIETTSETLIALAEEGMNNHLEESSPEEISEAREELEESELAFIWAIDIGLDEEREALEKAQNAVTDATETSATITYTVMAVTLVVVAGLAYYVSRTILQPLNSLRSTAERMQAGDLKVRSSVHSQDELGQFAATFNAMADSIEARSRELAEQLAETEKARAKAEQSDKVKSAFLASMSHELRTPLNAVINFTRFVIDGDTGPVNEQQTELLTEVVGSAKHLLNLINDVLDMSKIEAGSLNLFIEDDVSVSSLLNSTLTTAQGLLAGKPVRLHASIEPDLPLLRGDSQRIFQILLNIMSNACKFTEEGDITVRAHAEGSEIQISISDTGPGIAPEDQAKVFEAFKQTSAGLRQGGGTGLGMPIARSLAEAHGGRLWLESEYGKGATFHLALPVKSEALTPLMA